MENQKLGAELLQAGGSGQGGLSIPVSLSPLFVSERGVK